MKKLFEVTSEREWKNRTRSFAYQLQHNPTNKNWNVIEESRFKVIKITKKTSTIPGSELYYTVHIRYYDYKTLYNLDTLCTLVDMFDTYPQAIKKVIQMVKDNGSGTLKQWKRFKDSRE